MSTETNMEYPASTDTEEYNRPKMPNDINTIKHETIMDDVLGNSILPSIMLYLPPRDILNCIQTSKKWKEEIDTDYVWNNRFLPSMILHLPPHDIAQCIAASTKWNDKINTVEAFWERVVNATVSTKIVDAIEYHASKLFCCSYGLTNIINYESIALAFSLEKNLTVTHIGERFGNSLPSMLFNVTNCTPTPIDGVPYELAIVVYVQRSYLVCRRRTTQHRRGVPAARKSRTVNERT